MRSPYATFAALGTTLGLGLACATASLPPGPPASTVAQQTLLRMRSLYLRPEQVDQRVLGGAIEALERRFDPVRFEQNGTRGELWVGAEHVAIATDPDAEPEEFLANLSGVLEFVRLRLGADGVEEELEPEETLELLALRGALGALDRHSTIFSGKGTEDFQIRFSGELSGIGARIGRRDGDLVAVRVFPESPAQRAGLQDGDAIMGIDGEPTRPMTVSEAVGKIRGPVDSLVVLTARREKETLEIPIKRGKVTVPTVEAESLSPGVGYARVLQISRSTPAEFEKKIAGLGDIRGLVLDLRSNSGGSMLAAARLADMFLSEGTIVRTVGRGGAEVSGLQNRARASPEVKLPYPIVVLVDASTASAAEILAGALSPLPRVVVIGQRTFGKGVVQRIYPLPERNLLKLTVAEYLLSDDRVIDHEGVEPHVELFPVASDRIAPLAEVPDGALPYLRTTGEDDRFPIEVGRAILQEGLAQGLAAMRVDAEKTIRTRLGELGVEWDDAEAASPEEDPGEIEIEVRSSVLEAARDATISVRVRNLGPVPIPGAWATIAGPVADLESKALDLGTLPAGGEAQVEVAARLAEELSAGEIPMHVHVASRLRPVASRRVVLQTREQIPDLEIVVARDGEMARVTLRNRSEHDSGQLRVDLEGTFRVVETIPSGGEETVELPLAGGAEHVGVTLFGPLAERRVRIPLPESTVRVNPPRVTVTRTRWLGLPRIRLEASDEAGLREGWISLDGDKKAYTGWNGKPSGSLWVRPSGAEHKVLTKVETLSGVAVFDQRTLIAD